MSSEHEDDADIGLGLDDLLPEPESPLPAPFSFATYEPPDSTGLELEDEGRIVTRLVGSHPLWGHHLWNTARTMSNYLLQNRRLWKGKAVAELGAGAGLPSIVCAAGGASKVVVTDYPDAALVENLDYNLDINLPGPSRRGAVAAGYVWGQDPSPLLSALPENQRSEGFDLLLLSDLVFNHSQHPALVKSVNTLLRPSSSADPEDQPCALVFFTHHRPHLADADMAFFPLLSSSSSDQREGGGWAYEKVVEDWTGPMFAEDPGDERVRGTVHGWRAWRVREGQQPGERPSRVPLTKF